MVEKETIKRIIKISCIIQTLNALMDLIMWFKTGLHVPSWTISGLILGYTIILLAYDKI